MKPSFLKTQERVILGVFIFRFIEGKLQFNVKTTTGEGSAL